MSYRDIVKGQLRVDEDERCKPYRCTAGKLTVGVGRNLDDKGLRPDEIALMLDNDVTEAEADARALVPNFDTLSDVRKAALINMAFNLGRDRLSRFVNTLRAVNEHRFDDAAEGMLESLWAKQVGQRAVRLAKQMKEG
jgi:lysozyme